MNACSLRDGCSSEKEGRPPAEHVAVMDEVLRHLPVQSSPSNVTIPVKMDAFLMRRDTDAHARSFSVSSISSHHVVSINNVIYYRSSCFFGTHQGPSIIASYVFHRSNMEKDFKFLLATYGNFIDNF